MKSESSIVLNINELPIKVSFSFSHADPSVGIFEPNIFDIKLNLDFDSLDKETQEDIVKQIKERYHHVYR